MKRGRDLLFARLPTERVRQLPNLRGCCLLFPDVYDGRDAVTMLAVVAVPVAGTRVTVETTAANPRDSFDAESANGAEGRPAAARQVERIVCRKEASRHII